MIVRPINGQRSLGRVEQNDAGLIPFILAQSNLREAIQMALESIRRFLGGEADTGESAAEQQPSAEAGSAQAQPRGLCRGMLG